MGARRAPGVQAPVAFRTQVTPANPSGLRLSNSPGPPPSSLSGLGCQHGTCRQAMIYSLPPKNVFLTPLNRDSLDKQGNSVSGAAGPYRIADYDRYTRVLAVAETSNTCDGNILIAVERSWA
jgi:hypothetical protein